MANQNVTQAQIDRCHRIIDEAADEVFTRWKAKATPQKSMKCASAKSAASHD